MQEGTTASSPQKHRNASQASHGIFGEDSNHHIEFHPALHLSGSTSGFDEELFCFGTSPELQVARCLARGATVQSEWIIDVAS